MGWLNTTLNSSIGKKLIMSLAGLFLIVFLVVHLGINLLILLDDNSYYNAAANFMASNVLIKVFEVFLFGGFLLHIFYGILLQIQNWMARPSRYMVENLTNQTSFFSKYMIHTAIVVLIFLIIHLFDFYFKAKIFHTVAIDPISGHHDLAALVEEKFKLLPFVIFYLVALAILGFHLNHGFQSAFQSLGINHNKYTPFIKLLGLLYSILVPFGFALIPIIIYFFY